MATMSDAMIQKDPVQITSRDNPLLVALRKLAQDSTSYRKGGAVWVEGEHLCEASVQRGRSVAQALLTQAAWDTPHLRALASHAGRVAVVSDALFDGISGLESHGRIGFLIEHVASEAMLEGVPTVVLDRLQDAGNVGTIIRSAAALGFKQIVSVKGTAALWSAKVLRSGMGAHFGMHLVESVMADRLHELGVPLIAASSHARSALPDTILPYPCAWVFGHEGQGVNADLMRACAVTVRIPQPGGEESLNVASAAGICLYESLRQQMALDSP